MSMDVREYDLNLIPGSVPEIVKINQYDKGIQYAFTIYQGEKKFSIPAGSTVLLTGTKPDGLGFTYSCTFSGAVVSVTIGDQVAVLNGKVDAEITIISSSSVRLGTANFVFLVEPAALQDDTAVSDSDFPAIVKAADHIDDAKKYADNAAQSAKDAKASASSAASAAKNAIADEVTRAKAAEAANAKAITDETARAKKAEEANTKSITDETTRAKAAEAANSKAVTAETTRAKKAEEANANAIATKMDADPALFSRVASTDINRVGFSYVKILTDAPDGVNAYGHIFIDAEPGRMGGDLDNKVIFYVPYNTGRVFFRLVHDGKADDWVEIAPYSAVTTLSNKLIALGTDSYSLVDFVNDKIQFNSNDDYLHTYLVGGVTYVFSGDTTYKSFRDVSDNNTTLSTVGGTKADATYTPEKSGVYCLRWYKTTSDTALKSLKLTCSTVGGAHQHLNGISRKLNTEIENLDSVVSKKASLVPTGMLIPKNSDLNDKVFTAVGSYYCPAVLDGQTLTNVPEKTAFMMSVYNPLSKDTGQISDMWQYRLQEIMTYDARHKYIRMVASGSDASAISYGDWKTEY